MEEAAAVGVGLVQDSAGSRPVVSRWEAPPQHSAKEPPELSVKKEAETDHSTENPVKKEVGTFRATEGTRTSLIRT